MIALDQDFLFDALLDHIGHDIELARLVPKRFLGDVPEMLALECNECRTTIKYYKKDGEEL